MTLHALRDYYSRDSGNPTRGEQQNAAALAAGTDTPWFSFTPRNGKSNVTFGVFKMVATVTATGAISPNAGTDSLDLFIGGGGGGGFVAVAPSPGASSRAKSLTRQFVEAVWAVSTNTSPGVAAAPTFASASASVVTVYLVVALGGPASAVKLHLTSTITAVYTTNATIAYTSITSYIISSEYSGVMAWNEEKTPSLGAGLQQIMTYAPKEIAPDFIFLQGESSATITQVLIETTDGQVMINSTDTDVQQNQAAFIAPIAGATYTTTAGFVIAGNQKLPRVFDVNFVNAAVHYIGFFQSGEGETVIGSEKPAPVEGTPAVSRVGTETASGGVAISTKAPTGGGGGAMPGPASHRSRPP